ncbi:MAG TPA: hypothetical protein VLG16_00275 [Candidatus Saccharimonadales bacterium]|nr:hypothetical protein [Candidatus Saccharimonadales bacterium]
MKLAEAFIAYLNGRAKTQLYGLFVTWILILHGSIVFTCLFTDQQLIYKRTGLLKNEYIAERFFAIYTWRFWIFEIARFALACLLTYLMIWVFPKYLLAKAYEKELEADYGRKSQKLGKDLDLEKERNKLAKTQLDTVDKEKKVIAQQEDLEDKEVKTWKTEYRETSQSLKNALNDVIRAVFEHKGHLEKYIKDGYDVDPQVPSRSVAIAYSNNLIELSDNGSRVALTKKGRFFVSQKL